MTSTKVPNAIEIIANKSVSFYRNIKSTRSKETDTIGQILHKIKSGEWEVKTTSIRNALTEGTDRGRRLFKTFKENSPAHTFGGTFKQKSNGHLIQASGFICLDFDDIGNPGQFRDELKTHSFIYAAWISLSGTGVKCLVVIPQVENDADFKQVFSQLQKILPTVDPACSDISRACFVSFDPGLWVNTNATNFELRNSEEATTADNTFIATAGDDSDTISNLIKQIRQKQIDITQGYERWRNIGYVFAPYGETGRAWFHEVSRYNEKYSESETDEQFDRCMNAARPENSVKIGTFIKFCKDAGITPEMPTIRSGKNKIEPKIITLPDGVEYNDITQGLTYLRKPISTKQLHDLWWETPKKKRPSYDSYYHQLIAQATRYNPFVEFFNIPWTGTDQFKILAQYIETDGGFTNDLRKHIIRGINQLMGQPGSSTHHINRVAFILQGGTNIGKSTFLRRVTLRDMLDGFSSEIDMAGSKTEVHRMLCQIANLINEEIDSVTSQEIRNLKPIISYSGGSLRLPYDKAPTPMRRIATLWGSVNPGEFLLETNDRWIVYEIRNIDFGYTSAVNFPDMWRQCFAEWKKNPLAGELSKEDVSKLSERASKHLIVSPLEQYVREVFKGDEKANPMSMHDIRQTIEILYHNVNERQLGRVMTAAFGKYKAGQRMVDGKRGTFYMIKTATTNHY